MSFTQKKITLTFKLGKGSFGESGFDTVVLAGHRASVQMHDVSGPSKCKASVRVWGMSMADMNNFSSTIITDTGQVLTRFNQVQIEAGDSESMSVIFQGQLDAAVVDMSGSPDVSMVFSAHSGGFEAMTAVAPRSFPNSADAAVILQGLALAHDYKFENKNNLSVMLATPYYCGSVWDQMWECVRDANIEWNGLSNGVLAIWPKGGSRDKPNDAVLISKETGMVGYPVQNGTLLSVKTLFNPNLEPGRLCQVKSDFIKYANGMFGVFNISHDISSELPGGPWFSSFIGSPPIGRS